MACSIGCLPIAEPIESKLVDMLWPNDNVVAAPVNRKRQKCRSACQRVNIVSLLIKCDSGSPNGRKVGIFETLYV